MNVLLYDYMQVAGGAERVTLTLAQALPGFRTVVSRVYPEAEPLLAGTQLDLAQLGTGWSRLLGRIPEAMVNFRWRCPAVADADCVIYSGFYAPMAVHGQRGGRRIYYCHTIPRFAYDLFEHHRARLPIPVRWLYDAAMRGLRREYRRAVLKMDRVLVNSENVRRRLREHLGIDAEVVHPPVATQRFTWRGDGDAYLSLARLTPGKRVDVIVEAFRGMPGRRLVVLSGGPEMERLRAMAKDAPNIEFAGWQSEASLRDWVGNARAAIYLPVDEDFGLSPVEAMAAGKPVIGVAEGGLLETVVHGRTGWLIDGVPTAQKVLEAVDRLEAMQPASLRRACEERAGLFGEAVFLQRMKGILEA